MQLDTQFAKCDGISVAYQTFGAGPDLVICPGWVTNVEYGWEVPERARFHEELARFARVTIFDKRGTGLSDRNVGAATLEERMDDLRAVMDASSITEDGAVADIRGLMIRWPLGRVWLLTMKFRPLMTQFRGNVPE